jgi:DNA uptake protein ComE-like DNA-binding protein
MTIRGLLSFVARAAILGIIVYAALHVDFRRLVEATRWSAPSERSEPSVGESPSKDALPAVGPCVDVNTASRSDLERIIHIGANRSREIMERRLVRPFSSLDDLRRVTGLGTGDLEDIRRQGLACVS